MTRAKVEQAEADVARASDLQEEVRLAVALQVQEAVISVQEASERVSTTAGSAQLAEKALRLANDRYSSGLTVLVEVADAESALTQARFNAVQAQYDYAIAVAQLERATATQPEAELLLRVAEGASKDRSAYPGPDK